MPFQPDDLLLSLQSSLRNALATFGADSTQYRTIKLTVNEYAAKLAMEGLSISSNDPKKEEDQDVNMD